MGWKRVLTDGIMGDKKKAMTYDAIRCPYGVTCPSHIPFKNARKPKIKLIQRISPMAYEYKCRWCGCNFVYGAVNPDKVRQKEQPHMVNDSFLHRKI